MTAAIIEQSRAWLRGLAPPLIKGVGQDNIDEYRNSLSWVAVAAAVSSWFFFFRFPRNIPLLDQWARGVGSISAFTAYEVLMVDDLLAAMAKNLKINPQQNETKIRYYSNEIERRLLIQPLIVLIKKVSGEGVMEGLRSLGRQFSRQDFIEHMKISCKNTGNLLNSNKELSRDKITEYRQSLTSMARAVAAFAFAILVVFPKAPIFGGFIQSLGCVAAVTAFEIYRVNHSSLAVLEKAFEDDSNKTQDEFNIRCCEDEIARRRIMPLLMSLFNPMSIIASVKKES